MAYDDAELAGKSLMEAALSRTGKVRVWHAMTQNWQINISWWLHSVGQARSGVAYHDTELAGKSLTVAALIRTDKVRVWQDKELAGKAPHDGQSVVSGGLPTDMVLCITIWTN